MYILYLSSNQSKEVNDFITSTLKKMKHTVSNGMFTPDSKDKSSKLAKITREIKKSDALVVEASSTNFDLGRLMTLAIFQHKPLLILQEKGKEQDVDLGANRLVNNKTYTLKKITDLEKKLEDFMKAVKKQRLTYRFNLMLSRDINSYLMDQAQEKGISKADYIRSLIIQDMNE